MLNRLIPLRNAGLALVLTASFAGKASAEEIGPEETFNAMRDSVAAGRYGDVIQLLPKSYQADLNGLVNKFATKMDADLWKAGADIVRSVSTIMNTKKDIIAGSKFFKQLDETKQGEVMDNWDNVATAMSAFTESGILDLEYLKETDIDEIFNGPVSKMVEKFSAMEIPDKREFDEAMAMLKEAKAELVSRDGDTATMRFTGPKGNSTEGQLVLVEGRWIPADMASGWKDAMALADEGLNQMNFDTPEFQQNKLMAMMGIGMIKGTLSQLEKAESSADFDAALESLQKLFGGGGGFPLPQ